MIEAIEAIAKRLRGGGRLIYAGAGTSGRLAMLDAVECVPTFSVSRQLVTTLIAGLIVPVTENHPLPGVDFDVSTRDRVLEMLLSGGDRVLVVTLRDPYELAELPDVADYLCTFGPRAASTEAAAQVLFGEFEADGESPVSVPGAGIEAR